MNRAFDPLVLSLPGTNGAVPPRNETSEQVQLTEAEPDAVPPPFPLHCLPLAVQAMAEAVCATVRVPASLAGPVALGILSGCVGAGLEVESGPSRTSRPNLYLLVSAASGSGKSEAMRLLATPLLAREQAAVEVHRRAALPNVLADVEMLEAEIGTLKKAAAKLDRADAEARTRLRIHIGENKAARATAEAAMQPPVLVVENVTTEKLAVMLSQRGETLFSLSGDAGSIVNNLLGRYLKEGTDESLYLKSWTGEGERVDRQGRESVTLHRPCLAVLWLTQPDKVERLLSKPALTDGGLLPRFLLCHSGCEPQEMTEDGDGASGVPAEVSAAWEELVGGLLDAYRLRVAPAAVVRPTDAAAALFREHFNASVRRYHAGELRDVNAFRARWTEQGWRIALCLHASLHLADADKRELAEDTARRALEIADWFTRQQLAILANGRAEQTQIRLESLCAKLASHGGVATLRDLRGRNGFDEVEVRSLAVAFPTRIKVETRVGGAKGGRPSELAYLV